MSPPVRLALAALALSVAVRGAASCAGLGPYLYATLHGGSGAGDVNQVLRLTTDGCVGGGVLASVPSSVELRELRGMALLADGGMLVANAYKHDSAVYRFGGCAGDGTRPFVGTAATPDSMKSLKHPYGIAVLDSSGSFLVSSQDTDEVGMMPGGSTVFKLPDGKDEGVRGIELCGAYVFVADSGSDGVYVLDASTFGKVAWVDLGGGEPTDVACDPGNERLLVSVRGSKSLATGVAAVALGGGGGGGTAFAASDLCSDAGLAHPAGIAVDPDNGQIYVAAHDARDVFSFAPDGSGGRALFGGALPDDVELLALSGC